MPDIVSLGSINVDLVRTVESTELAELADRYPWFPPAGATIEIDTSPDGFETDACEQFLGGKGANQAVAASKGGAETTLLGKVGTDQADYGVLESLRDAGVDVDGVATSSNTTGKAYIFVDETGENRIGIVEGANGAVGPAYVHDRYHEIQSAECVLLQNEIPATAMHALLDALDDEDESDRPTVILDPVPTAGIEAYFSHESIDIVTPNEVEYRALEGILDAFDGIVIRTQGPDDVVVTLADGSDFTVSPPAVTVADTTAAGDVFTGFLAARYARGDELRAAVEIAAVAASLSTTEDGAQQSIPSMDAIRRFD